MLPARGEAMYDPLTSRSFPSRQATLADAAQVSGIGLHGGKQARVTLRPAEPDSGIVVRRLSGGPAEDVVASWRNYRRQYLCSGIAGASGVPILTVEHLLATLSVFGIDNALIEIEGSEIPIGDGSALAWCVALQQAGTAVQAAPRRYLRVLAPVEVRKGDSWLRIDPDDRFSLCVTTRLPPFAGQRWEGVPTPAAFLRDIAPSRSHGPLAAVLAKMYFAVTGKPHLRGAGPRTVALTVGRHYLGGMRLPDETVRHRTLDLIGDLALAGLPLIGKVTAMQPGHALNASFVRTLMKRRDCWREEARGAGSR